MSSRPVLVDLAKLGELIAGPECGDPGRNECLNARWLRYLELWDSRAGQAECKYLLLRSAVVIGGMLIPALVGLREIPALQPYAWSLALASIVVSLLIAICAGLESFFAFGEIWCEKRKRCRTDQERRVQFLQIDRQIQGLQDTCALVSDLCRYRLDHEP